MDLSNITATQGFIFWSAVWILLIVLPPGSKEILTAYRLNFTHGLLSSLAAIACLKGLLPESLTTTATISYFIVDFINIMINDFIFRVPSYQKPSARKVEYAHHIFCCFVGVMSEFYYKTFCTFETNPFVRLMFAEFPTPFLIAWRYTGSDIFGGLFALMFLAFRIIYHGFVFIPDCIRSCHASVGYGFGIPYNLMNLYFFYFVIAKFFQKPDKKDKKQT